MDFILLLKALILGIVEGLTEFLPVSSTGHLIIVCDLLNYTNEQSKVFDIVIQLGAILAVCWSFRARIGKALGGLAKEPEQQRFAALLLVGFMPAAVLGLLLHHAIKTYLFNPYTVAAALIVGGLLILLIEKRAAPTRVQSVEDMRWPDALKVGFAQAIAMFPGVSRSGATIMGGMMFGLSRQTATEFSFFLAIPTMFAATFYDVAKNWQLLQLADLPVFAVGFVAAFGAGLLTVKGLLRFIAHHTFVGFAWYRIIFGGIVLLTAAFDLVRWQAE
ncbi:MAG: undecaprenyl-diphosphate phosphatase [Zoogloeaceae bacterium]|jgi:undecaprenyl-diphosphatase|nr:undecaprenyl-diphosphate phosphatase [Zoogloeaceae bacterium]